MRACRRVSGLIGLLAMGLVGASCLDLPDLQPDVCGNRTLEPGEDCELRFAEGDLETPFCISPGEPNACRYSCAAIPDAPEARYPCPEGWGCGRDDLCRVPSAAFSEAIPTGQPVGRWFSLADVDGDGELDIVWVSDATAAVDYLDGGAYLESYRFPFEATGLPSVTDADRDGLADLVSPTDRGLELLRGTPERTLAPTVFTGAAVRLESDFDAIAVELVPEVVEVAPGQFERAPGEEVLIPTARAWRSINEFVSYGVEDAMSGVELEGIGSPDTEMVAARFDEVADVHGAYTESPEQIAVSQRDRVVVLRPSWYHDGRLRYLIEAPTEAAPGKPPVPATHPSRTEIAAPTGFVIDRMRVTQLNREAPDAEGMAPGKSRWPCGADTAVADDHVDLVIMARGDDDSASRVAVAFGVGDGTFHADPCSLPDVQNQVITADARFAEPAVIAGCRGEVGNPVQDVLAFRDLDGDGMPDPITTSATYLSRLLPGALLSADGLCSPFSRVEHPEQTLLADVVVGDMDGDGLADAIANILADPVAKTLEPNLRYLTTNGTAQLQRTTVLTDAPVDKLTGGDFDGDGLMDVAFAQTSSTAAREVSVVFGEFGAVPAQARSIGRVAELDLIRTGRLIVGQEADAPEELVLATRRDEDNVFRFAQVEGRGDRQLRAPFRYAPLGAGVGDQEAVAYLPIGGVIAPFDGLCDPTTTALFVTGRGACTPGSTTLEATFGSGCVDADSRVTINEDVPSDVGLSCADVLGTAVVPIRTAVDAITPVVAQFNPNVGQRSLTLYAAEQDPETGEWRRAESAFTLDDATVAGAGAPGSSVQAPTSPLRRWSPFLNNVAQPCALWPDQPEGVAFLAIRDLPDTCNGDTADVPAQLELHVVSSARFTSGGQPNAPELDPVVGQQEGEHVVGFACLNLDDDAAQELAYVVVVGALDQCTGSTSSSYNALLRYVDVDPSTGEAVTKGNIELGGPFLPFPNLPPVSGLAAGDFNRDGVEDLFLATPENGFVLLQQPRSN